MADAITSLTMAAVLSLVVERIIEAIKHLRDDSAALAVKETAEAKQAALVEVKERIDLVLASPASAAAKGSEHESGSARASAPGHDEEPSERHEPIMVVRLGPGNLGKAQTALFFSLFGSGLGILLAELFDLRLVSLLLGAEAFEWLDSTLTGVVIGGGSQPVHVLLRFVTSRRIPGDGAAPEPPSEERPEETAVPVAAVLGDESHWRPIAYDGGVHPERLEHKHLRRGEPNLIVYHHTAMSSSIPFQGIVDEFLVHKGWSTGYHCVIMPDGRIEPFCRWDRFGSHVKGRNRLSLGVAFHGNFHVDRNDRFSNHDGRFGPQKPSPEQLDAGARVVALWVKLYEIAVDFERSILPHRSANPGHTVCPGSEFPHRELREKITFYETKWSESDHAKSQIELFKSNPYIYATRREPA